MIRTVSSTSWASSFINLVFSIVAPPATNNLLTFMHKLFMMCA